jgi:outer membrane protein assembly factor BamB
MKLITAFTLFTVILATYPSAQSASPPFPMPGEWPTFRHDKSLGGRAQGVGHIMQPKIIWKHFVGRMEATVIVQPGSGPDEQLITADERPGPAEDAQWAKRWFPPRLEALIAGRVQPVPLDATTTYADVVPEIPGWERIEFANGFNLPSVNGQWQDGPGTCQAWKDGRWQQVWKTENVSMDFGPYPIVDDFDGDGRPEVAVLPWYKLQIYDARTGKLKDECRFAEGRSYGFLGAYDLDGDGKKELLVMGDFAKHVDVLGYRKGRLSLFWQQKIEPDLLNTKKILRLIPRPAAELDGDGVMEIVLNLFNDTGDNRWHIVIRDGITGKIKADLADEIVRGVADVNGDGLCELLTVSTVGQGIPQFGTLRLRGFRKGRLESLWENKNSGWTIHQVPLELYTQNYATRGTEGVLVRNVTGRAAVILRRPGDTTGEVTLSPAVWDGKGFQPQMSISGPGLEGLALDANGAMLVRSSLPPGRTATLRPRGARAEVVGCVRRGLEPSPVVVARGLGEERPTIIVQGAAGELVAFRAPSGGQPVAECWRMAGRGQSTNWPQSFGPVIADLAGEGRREVVCAAQAPSGCARVVATDLSGTPRWHHDFDRFSGDPPVWNTGGTVLWQAGHFTDPIRQDVLVTLRRSMMHSEETFLLSGSDGHEVWHRAREESNWGCGGQPFAVADFNRDGRDDAASFYPALNHILDGPTGRNLIAKTCSWPGVPIPVLFFGQATAGVLDDSGEPSLLYTSGRRYMVGRVRADGSLAWSDAYDHAASGYPAIGDFQGDGKPAAVWVGFDDGARCYDAATGKVLWKINVGEGCTVNCSCGDVNGDGRDEAVFVVGQTLCCAGWGGPGKSGPTLWTLPLPTQVSTPVIADVAGRGALSILVTGTDGCVYCIQ